MIQAGSPDIITYTTVCSDFIPILEPFKSNCMPVFLLVSAGDIVAYVHGADGKQMKEVRNISREPANKQLSFHQVLKYQIENEINILKSEGSVKRKSIPLADTLPPKVNMEDENEQ